MLRSNSTHERQVVMGGKTTRFSPAVSCSTNQVQVQNLDVDDECIDQESYMRLFDLAPSTSNLYHAPSIEHHERSYPTKLHFVTSSYFVGNTRTSLFDTDFTSNLGQLLTYNFHVSNIPGIDFDQLINKYERYCCTDPSAQRLRDRDSTFPSTFAIPKHSNKCSNHQYCFTRPQKRERSKVLQTGLSKRSRMLKRLCKPCSVKLQRIIHICNNLVLDIEPCSVRLTCLPSNQNEVLSQLSSLDTLENHVTLPAKFPSNHMIGREIQIDGSTVIDLCSDDESCVNSCSDSNILSSKTMSHSIGDAKSSQEKTRLFHVRDRSFPSSCDSFVNKHFTLRRTKSRDYRILAKPKKSQDDCNVVLENVENLLKQSTNGMAYVKGTRITVPLSEFVDVKNKVDKFPPGPIMDSKELLDGNSSEVFCYENGSANNIRNQVRSINDRLFSINKHPSSVLFYHPKPLVQSECLSIFQQKSHNGSNEYLQLLNLNTRYTRKASAQHPLTNSNRMVNSVTSSVNGFKVPDSSISTVTHGDVNHSSDIVNKVSVDNVSFFENHLLHDNLLKSQACHRLNGIRGLGNNSRNREVRKAACGGVEYKDKCRTLKEKYEHGKLQKISPVKFNLKTSVRNRGQISLNGSCQKEVFPIIFKCMLCNIAMALNQNFQQIIAKHVINFHGGFGNVTILKQVMKNSQYTLIKITGVK